MPKNINKAIEIVTIAVMINLLMCVFILLNIEDTMFVVYLYYLVSFVLNLMISPKKVCTHNSEMIKNKTILDLIYILSTQMDIVSEYKEDKITITAKEAEEIIKILKQHENKIN